MSLNRRKLSIDQVMEEMEEEFRRESISLSVGNLMPATSEEVDARMTGFARRPSRSPVPSPRHKPGNLIPSRMTVEKYYDMSNLRIGKALIFNQRDFNDKGTRKGTNKDAMDLEDVLEDFGFEVSLFQDYKYAQIMSVLDKIASEDHSDRDCLVVVVMSHGSDDGKIYASDLQFDVTEVWEPFIGDHCPSLIGKPKLFFIQACRGSMTDPGVFVKTKSNPNLSQVKADSIDAEVVHEETFVIPKLADLLVMYSTSEGHISFRNPDSGSWFIQSLCQELRENPKEELLNILTGVMRRVAFGFQSNIPANTAYDAAKQMPCFMSMLTKTFYLRKRNKAE